MTIRCRNCLFTLRSIDDGKIRLCVCGLIGVNGSTDRPHITGPEQMYDVVVKRGQDDE